MNYALNVVDNNLHNFCKPSLSFFSWWLVVNKIMFP